MEEIFNNKSLLCNVCHRLKDVSSQFHLSFSLVAEIFLRTKAEHSSETSRQIVVKGDRKKGDNKKQNPQIILCAQESVNNNSTSSSIGKGAKLQNITKSSLQPKLHNVEEIFYGSNCSADLSLHCQQIIKNPPPRSGGFLWNRSWQNQLNNTEKNMSREKIENTRRRRVAQAFIIPFHSNRLTTIHLCNFPSPSKAPVLLSTTL